MLCSSCGLNAPLPYSDLCGSCDDDALNDDTLFADINAAASETAATLAKGAASLDRLVARHLPVESRRAEDPMLQATTDLYDATTAALARQPFKPRRVA